MKKLFIRKIIPCIMLLSIPTICIIINIVIQNKNILNELQSYGRLIFYNCIFPYLLLYFVIKPFDEWYQKLIDDLSKR